MGRVKSRNAARKGMGMKRLIAVVMVSALALAACGGSNETSPAAFEDVEVAECATTPVAVPSITVLGHRVEGVTKVQVCADVAAAVGVVPEIAQYDDCGEPCYSVEFEDFDIASDAKIEITLERQGSADEQIVFDPEPVDAGSETGRICVVGVGGPPDPCSDRVTNPKNVTATPTRKSVSLNWKPSIDTGNDNLLGYEVWRSEVGADGPFSVIGTISETSFLDTNVTRTTEYWYYVVGFDADGNRSGSSNTVSAITK